MPLRRLLPALTAIGLCAAACDRPIARQYEYEEQIYLALDGSATVVVNASVPSLVALRGLALDPDPRARFDRAAIRAAYEAPGVRVVRVSRPWRRHGRRFVQVRVAVDDIRRLGRSAAFAGTACGFSRAGEEILYRHSPGPPAGGAVGDVGWTGDELVAFRAHLPSRILYHNVRNLERGTVGEVERGNILTWEQRIADRLEGAPLDMEARIEARSIFRTTMWVFLLSGAAAVAVLAGSIWWMRRKGRRATGPPADPAPSSPPR